MSHSSFCLHGARKSYAPNTNLLPVHLDIHLDLDIPNKTCQGEIITTVRASSRPTLQQIKLNAVGFLNVEVKAVSGPPVLERYDGETISLYWEKPFEPNEERKVLVAYKVVDPIDAMLFSSPDKQYPNRSSYVMTDHETERARYWLPCVDYPIVRPTLEFRITSDESHTIVANGKLVSETKLADRPNKKTAHWKLDYPCPSYLTTFAVGEFEVVTDETVDGMPIAYYAAKGTDKELLKDCFRETPAMVKWMAKKLNAPFPFKDIKYYQIVLPHMPTAMENISLVTWSDQYLFDKKLAPERRGLFDSINVHEMAHSYFGDAMIIKHFEHAWLKESWATYIEASWTEDRYGDEHFQYEMLSQADMYIHEAQGKYARPIVTREFNSSWQLFDSHLYPGGSWRLHMLRKMLGDDSFWTGVSNYIHQFSKGLVETIDFQRCLEAVSGLNLHQFFDQWILGNGFPKLQGEFDYNLEKREVTISLDQAQPEDWTVFDIEIDVEITCDLGKVYRSKLVFQDGKKKAVTKISLSPESKKPATLRFDPDNKVLFVLSLNPGEDILENTFKIAKDLKTRMWAGAELVNIGNNSSLRRLEDAIFHESYFGIRVKIAEKLSEIKTSRACHLFAKILIKETDPRALFQIASFCKIRDPSIEDAILTVLRREDLPYRAHANLLQALGAQRNHEHFDKLMAAAKSDYTGFNGIVRAGAYKGLAEIQKPEAYEFLKEKTKYGKEMEMLRAGLVLSLAKCASLLSEQIRADCADFVVDLFRDPSWRVRRAAMDALTTLEASNKLKDLENFKTALSKQYHVFVDKNIHTINAAADNHQRALGSAKLRTDLDALEAKVRSLQDQLAAALENKK